MKAPFVDGNQIQWTVYNGDVLPQKVFWNGKYWNLHTPVGSTYYLKDKQLSLPFMPDSKGFELV